MGTHPRTITRVPELKYMCPSMGENRPQMPEKNWLGTNSRRPAVRHVRVAVGSPWRTPPQKSLWKEPLLGWFGEPVRSARAAQEAAGTDGKMPRTTPSRSSQEHVSTCTMNVCLREAKAVSGKQQESPGCQQCPRGLPLPRTTSFRCRIQPGCGLPREN